MSSTRTPSQSVSNLLHLVTQWMSRWNGVRGSRPNSSQLHEAIGFGPTFSPKRQDCVAIWGVGPAESTGKPSSRYWPGGRRAASSAGGGRPTKPRVAMG